MNNSMLKDVPAGVVYLLYGRHPIVRKDRVVEAMFLTITQGRPHARVGWNINRHEMKKVLETFAKRASTHNKHFNVEEMPPEAVNELAAWVVLYVDGDQDLYERMRIQVTRVLRQLKIDTLYHEPIINVLTCRSLRE